MYRHALLALSGALTLSTPLTAAAEAPVMPVAELQKLPPEAQQAYVLKRVAQQKARAAAGAVAADTTGPVLTLFDLKANATAGGQVTAKVAATDDLSGVRGLYLYAYGNGNAISLYHYWTLPQGSNQGTAAGDINRFIAPGTYTATWGYLFDEAGNYTYLGTADFAATGNAVVQVSNTKAVDTVPPTVGTGKLLTTKVSLSAVQPGTDRPAYAGAELSVNDSGESGVSGLREAQMQFCLLDVSHCFWLFGNTPAVGLGKIKLAMGGQPAYYTTVAGKYYLKDVIVTDWGQHSTGYVSTRFGGTADFFTVFPAGDAITLRP
jgi:hypothetical protein